VTDAQRLRELVNGYRASQAIHVAVVLCIPDELSAGPRSADELAAATGAHADSLYRLLRALASIEVLHEEDGRRFALTELGNGLRSDVPESIAGWAAFMGRPVFWQTWGDLLHSIRTGENAFRHIHGQSVWEFRATRPEESVVFDRAMSSMTRVATEAVLAAYDFGRFGTVVDVGGGNGTLLSALLARYPEMHGVLFDQPHVVANAGEVLGANAARCEVVSGDFFESVPEGGDAYVLKWIIHDWEDPESIAILRNCRTAMRPDAALLMIERDIGPPNEAAEAKFSDLNMLVNPGGRERTFGEYEQLCAQAGLELTGSTPSASGMAVFEARPA